MSRLIDIGVKPFLVSASLRAVMAQRLIRRICSNCKQPLTPDERVLNLLGIEAKQSADATYMYGKGCPTCNSTGFRGRVGIFEMFLLDEELSQMVYDQKSLAVLRQKAREMGMRTMREDGIRKVFAGITRAEEVLNATVSDSF